MKIDGWQEQIKEFTLYIVIVLLQGLLNIASAGRGVRDMRPYRPIFLATGYF